MITKETGLIGIDLDNCVGNDGRLNEFASQVVDELKDTYCEISPGGAGLHIWAYGLLPPTGRKNGKIEIYSENRFLTVTGNHLGGTAPFITDQRAAITSLHNRFFETAITIPDQTISVANNLSDAEIIARASAAKNGHKFSQLWRGDTTGYGSPSEADMALISILCFWTRDPQQIDRLFRQSGLMRAKWDRPDYSQRTISKALATVKQRYTPPSTTQNELTDFLTNWQLSAQWPGRTGETDQSIYKAHLGIVKRTGKLIYGASCRELAELAGFGRKAVSKANKRLVDYELLTVVSEGHSPHKPTEYELIDPRGMITPQPGDTIHTRLTIPTIKQVEIPVSQPTECPVLNLDNDIWRHRGLGKTGRSIYKALFDNGPLKQADIARISDLSKQIISRKIKRLLELKMVVRDEQSRYTAVLNVKELDIARKLGVLGVGQRQKLNHQIDRTLHRMRLRKSQI
jgi:DNA-binding transcriptional ArsR family regulator